MSEGEVVNRIKEIIKKTSWTAEELAIINNEYDRLAVLSGNKKTNRSCPACTVANINYFRSKYAR